MMLPATGGFLVALLTIVLGGLVVGKGQHTYWRFAASPHWLGSTARFLRVIGWSIIGCGIILITLLGGLLLALQRCVF